MPQVNQNDPRVLAARDALARAGAAHLEPLTITQVWGIVNRLTTALAALLDLIGGEYRLRGSQVEAGEPHAGGGFLSGPSITRPGQP